MFTNTYCAPRMSLLLVSGESSAFLMASMPRSSTTLPAASYCVSPSARPTTDTPLSVMAFLTSAKSMLTNPGIEIISEMPLTARASTLSHIWNDFDTGRSL